MSVTRYHHAQIKVGLSTMAACTVVKQK